MHPYSAANHSAVGEEEEPLGGFGFSRGWGTGGYQEPPPVREPRRVVITGIGLATPLGLGRDLTWRLLVGGACGIRELTAGDLPEVRRCRSTSGRPWVESTWLSTS